LKNTPRGKEFWDTMVELLNECLIDQQDSLNKHTYIVILNSIYKDLSR